jgi:hypothetical protein
MPNIEINFIHVSRARRSMSAANGALQTRDRSSPWRSRISGAPLARGQS